MLKSCGLHGVKRFVETLAIFPQVTVAIRHNFFVRFHILLLLVGPLFHYFVTLHFPPIRN